MSWLIVVLVFVASLLLAEGLKRLTIPRIGTQLPELILGTEQLPSRSFFEKHIQPSALVLPQRFGFLRWLAEPEKAAQQLEYAGRPFGMDAEQFFGVQLFMMIAGFSGAALYATWGLVFGGCGWPIAFIILPIGGFFGPRAWLSQEIKKREEAINLAMPDFLDLLSICVRAGIGFDNALRLVMERTTGPLGEELRRLMRELDIGEPRADAFRRLVDRNTSEDLRAFVDAVLHAEELGTPLSRTLLIQAEELRVHRLNRAKERASQASPKISLVTVFIIAPSVILLFLTALGLSVFMGEGFSLLAGP